MELVWIQPLTNEVCGPYALSKVRLSEWYLLETYGKACNFCHQSSEISTFSYALAAFLVELRISIACLMRLCRYSYWIVLSTLKKYSRAGRRPLAKLSGKYCMNSWLSFINGHMLLTLSSSYIGTTTVLTCYLLSNFFSSTRTSLRKSLLIEDSGGRYNYLYMLKL